MSSTTIPQNYPLFAVAQGGAWPTVLPVVGWQEREADTPLAQLVPVVVSSKTGVAIAADALEITIHGFYTSRKDAEEAKLFADQATMKDAFGA